MDVTLPGALFSSSTRSVPSSTGRGHVFSSADVPPPPHFLTIMPAPQRISPLAVQTVQTPYLPFAVTSAAASAVTNASTSPPTIFYLRCHNQLIVVLH